jgi:hypothetical protein
MSDDVHKRINSKKIKWNQTFALKIKYFEKCNLFKL